MSAASKPSAIPSPASPSPASERSGSQSSGSQSSGSQSSGSEPPARPPSAGKSSATGAYELLIAAIESGTLAPGSRLREVELAERFRISRTPVREALKRLETLGLVRHEPHHGAVVATLDYGRMAELYDIREVLEGTAARLAAIHATSTETEVMREMVERDRTLLNQPAELARTNRHFHRQVRLASRNLYLHDMLENMRLSLALLGGTSLQVSGRAARSVAEHAAIVAALERKNPDEAEAAAREHIRQAFKARITLRQE